MFSYFKKHITFDFIANILSNVSALKECREYMIENKMMAKIIELIKEGEINTNRKKHLIGCIRNLSFEYEKYE